MELWPGSIQRRRWLRPTKLTNNLREHYPAEGGYWIVFDVYIKISYARCSRGLFTLKRGLNIAELLVCWRMLLSFDKESKTRLQIMGKNRWLCFLMLQKLPQEVISLYCTTFIKFQNAGYIFWCIPPTEMKSGWLNTSGLSNFPLNILLEWLYYDIMT